MKRQRILVSVLAVGLGLLLALVAGLALAQGPEPASPAPKGAPAEGLSLNTPVGTAFTYQGQLIFDGTPVNDTCDFEFGLWDAPSGGSQVGGQAASGVEVNNGYFSVDLDFGSDFTGDARYLEIVVDCGGGSALLEPRVALTAAPYAHSLRPGAVVEGSGNYVLNATNTGTGDGIRAFSSATQYNWAALYGVNDSSGSGVYGSSSSGTGVYGSSSSGVGVYGGVGTASGKSPITGAAVWGDSADRPGVFGSSNSAGGVGGQSTSGPGVTGISDSGNGVSGASNSGDGVYGYSPSGHGVHGKANPPDGYGIYSEGNAYVDGNLFWSAKTSYVAVAAAAFHPTGEGYDFSNNGSSLWNEDSASDSYLAPVQLPHGATVTKLTFYWWDGSLSEGHCRLYRIDLAGSEWTMATAWTSGDAATPASSEDTAIDYAYVDNSQYAYYLWLELPDNLVAAYGAVIEYVFYEPY